MAALAVGFLPSTVLRERGKQRPRAAGDDGALPVDGLVQLPDGMMVRKVHQLFVTAVVLWRHRDVGSDRQPELDIRMPRAGGVRRGEPRCTVPGCGVTG